MIFTHMEKQNCRGEWLLFRLIYSALKVIRSEGSLACHTYCDTEHPSVMSVTPTLLVSARSLRYFHD